MEASESENEIKFLNGVGIEGDIITDLESSKLIKSMGFDKPSHWYWLDKKLSFVDKGLNRVKMGKRRMNHNKYDEFIYSAPTKKEVIKWINDKKLNIKY